MRRLFLAIGIVGVIAYFYGESNQSILTEDLNFNISVSDNETDTNDSLFYQQTNLIEIDTSED